MLRLPIHSTTTGRIPDERKTLVLCTLCNALQYYIHTGMVGSSPGTERKTPSSRSTHPSINQSVTRLSSLPDQDPQHTPEKMRKKLFSHQFTTHQAHMYRIYCRFLLHHTQNFPTNNRLNLIHSYNTHPSTGPPYPPPAGPIPERDFM